MIYGITYSSGNMDKSARLCTESMERNGVDSALFYGPKDVTHSYEGEEEFFYTINREILDSRRGGGFWLWKPYIILDRMNDMQDGDVLIYADAGVEFIAPISHIIDSMDENMFLFTNTHPNHHWTKRYTLDKMMPEWDDRYKKDTPWPQVQASVIVVRVCAETRRFIKEWLLWCQMPNIIDDNKCNEYDFFQDHRHDQSVLSILATQAGYKLHWWPTAYAEHIRVPGDTYPVLFNHHRRRDPGKGNGEPEWPQ